jgi:hypothetical protein
MPRAKPAPITRYSITRCSGVILIWNDQQEVDQQNMKLYIFIF